jgi:hypothetical protein
MQGAQFLPRETYLAVRRNDEGEAQSRSGAGQVDFLRSHQPCRASLTEIPGKIVENRNRCGEHPRGSTKMGTMELFKSDPDGYPWMLAGDAALMSDYYSRTYDEKVWGKVIILGKIRFLE